MPRVTSKPGGEMMVRALDAGFFVTPDGHEHFVEVGMRLKSSHPAVRLSPHSFVSDNLDDAEFAEARRTFVNERIYGHS